MVEASSVDQLSAACLSSRQSRCAGSICCVAVCANERGGSEVTSGLVTILAALRGAQRVPPSYAVVSYWRHLSAAKTMPIGWSRGRHICCCFLWKLEGSMLYPKPM